MDSSLKLKAGDYTVGWICALAVELAASCEMFDEEYPQPLLDGRDQNCYRFGRIGGHNVVICCLPSGRYGLVSATNVAFQMKASFKSIRFSLMVGIGGGVPNDKADIRLGDVVVSQPCGQHGGVVQYDMGKTLQLGESLRTGSLNSPPQVLLTATTAMEAAALTGKLRVSEYLAHIGSRLSKFAFPTKLGDRMYATSSVHVGGASCKDCLDGLIEREVRESIDVVMHYGTIASGNQVMRDGVTRDRISRELGTVLCFDMEAAGLMNDFPCSIIRGICDYSDAHKNKQWQPYAAAAAAAVAKELLSHKPFSRRGHTPS
ncbi:hypothetical protein LTR84_005200 [Exophiala bonariae]|uniref:Nucleoside phosphorylase domain-containing protein n=1 Tax=Exophiala bonariae TaxID=1690606 RepID=A0AAV9NSL0_9EURO|nr:hypothetical protein LTR84_005200 [Exophiala bonariae]